MYDRVVVAVDTSDHARHVTETGIAMAGFLDAPLEIVHVLERSILDAIRSGSDRKRVKRDRKAMLADLETMAADAGRPVTSRLEEGTPASQITRVASEEPGTLVVMGRQGRSGMKRSLLGGVTERVLGASPVPVVVDPSAETDRAQVGVEQILVPTDGSENAALAYPYAAAFATRTDASLAVLAVLDLQRAGGVFNAGGLPEAFVESLETNRDETLATAATELRESVSAVDVETFGRKTTGFDGVTGAIATFADENEVDLVVMGSHGRSNVRKQFLGSVTSTLLTMVDIPVLVVPRSSDQAETDAENTA